VSVRNRTEVSADGNELSGDPLSLDNPLSLNGATERTQTRRRWLGRVLVITLLVSGFSGCLSPTLPMPPPSRPLVTAPDEAGMIKISGVVNSHARAFVQNDRTNEIAGERTGASGRYEVEMAAEVGDRLLIWQTVNTEESQIREVIVPATDPLDLGTPAPGAAGAEGQ
jgi:hypothetical protein